MTRSFFSVIAVGIVGFALSPALMAGCKATGVGDPCTPEQEYDPTFNGFDEAEVNVESKSFQCQTRLCLVNHFQGRVSCPYGQDAQGNPPKDPSGKLFNDSHGNPIAACGVPGSTPDGTGKQSEPISGNANDPKTLATVKPECTDRTADKAVYCSCRCANVNGRTDDGANYCKCPDGFQCTQLVTPIGPTDTGLTGAYCIKSGTAYDPTNACTPCDPSTHDCG
jgi:hypothetical protein